MGQCSDVRPLRWSGRRPQGAPAGRVPQTAPVVNTQVRVATGLPARSLTAAAPPVMVTRYCTFAVSVAVGLIVSTLVVVLNEVAAATVAPVETRWTVTVPAATPVMLSLNVAVTLALRPTPVAPEAGEVAVIVGAGPVVNDQEVAVIVLPATSRTPETVAV